MVTANRRLFHITLTADPNLAHDILTLAEGRAYDVKVHAASATAKATRKAADDVVQDAAPMSTPMIPRGLSGREFVMHVLSGQAQISQKELMQRGLAYGFTRSAVSGGCNAALKDKTLKRPKPGMYARGRAFHLVEQLDQQVPHANGHANGHAASSEPSIASTILAVLSDGQSHRIDDLRQHVVEAGFSKSSLSDAIHRMLGAEQLRRVSYATYAL